MALFRSVSDQPPANLTAYNTSSTSIQITWNLVPPDEAYEATYAYEVTIKRAENSNDTMEIKAILGACVHATNMTLNQTDLLIYTAYNITVTGVTVKGFGKTSDEITVLTDEDSKYITIKCLLRFLPRLTEQWSITKWYQ